MARQIVTMDDVAAVFLRYGRLEGVMVVLRKNVIS